MNKKKLVGAVGLAAVMVIGGTFAYFNQNLTVDNPFDTGKYDSTLVEEFKPKDGENWEPGAVVNKDITVKNTGDYDVLVRVSFDEKWVNKDTGEIVKENKLMDEETGQADRTDGLVDADSSVVAKTLNKENWVFADGYWYYKTNLKPGKDTGIFLDAVKLLEDADMGNYITTKYYTTAATKPAEIEIGTDASNQWVSYTGELPKDATHNMVVTKQDSAKPGYGNANYTLTITAQTVQATKAAMTNAFGIGAAPAGCNWQLSQNKTAQ